MKRVLIITDLGHASPRIPGIAKYLAEFGWQANILTPFMSQKQKEMFLIDGENGLELLETKEFAMTYKDSRQTAPIHTIARKALRKIGVLQYLEYPDGHLRWCKIAEKYSQQALEESKYEMILSSSSPVSAHIIAHRVSARNSIPWVADLRDLWTRNHNYPYSRMRKVMETRLEKNTLSNASALTTVTPHLQRLLQEDYGNKAHWLPNGFHPSTVNARLKPLTDRFTITYTGQIYEARQDIAAFLEALDSWISREHVDYERVLFRYFGRSTQIVRRFSRQWPGLFTKSTEVHEPVSLSEAHVIQQRSDVLLMLNWTDPNQKGIATTKLYEYLATGQPILAAGGSGGDYVQQVLAMTGAGSSCCSKEEIINWLDSSFRNYMERRSHRAPKPSNKVAEFSYRSIAGKLTTLFDSVIADSNRFEPIGKDSEQPV